MREGPLAELFRKTEAAQRAESAGREGAQEPPEEEEGLDPERRAQVALEETVEHVHDFAASAAPAAAPAEAPALEPASAPDPAPEATAARAAAR